MGHAARTRGIRFILFPSIIQHYFIFKQKKKKSQMTTSAAPRRPPSQETLPACIHDVQKLQTSHPVYNICRQLTDTRQIVEAACDPDGATLALRREEGGGGSDPRTSQEHLSQLSLRWRENTPPARGPGCHFRRHIDLQMGDPLHAMRRHGGHAVCS